MSPEDNINSTKANHSGNPGLPDDIREQPVREFDNTPLDKAHSEGLIDPLTGEIGVVRPKPESTVDSKLSQNTEEEHGIRRFIKTKIGKATVVVAGLAVAGSAYAGISGASNRGPEKQITHSAGPTSEATPESTATPESAPTQAELIASHEIKAGQTPEALAKNVNSVFNDWLMAGTNTFTDDYNAEVAKTGDGSDATRAAFAEKYAEKQAVIYASALFGPNYATQPQFAKVVNAFIIINKDSLQLHWLTSSTNPDDKEPYVRSTTLDSYNIVSQSANTIQLSINFTDTTNASMNRASQSYVASGGVDPNGAKNVMPVTLQSNGTTETITAIDIINQ